MGLRLWVMFALIGVTLAWSTQRWFIGLCGVVALSALAQHEDMPRKIADVPGLNVANILLAWTLFMWFVQRPRRAMPSLLPAGAILLVVAYATILIVAYARGVLDLDSIQGDYRFWDFASVKGFTIEYLVNPIKYVIPAFLVYAGVRSRADVRVLLLALGAMAGLYAVIVLKNLPIATLLDEELFMATRRRIQRQTGLHANDMALVMVQAFWAALLYWRVARGWLFRTGMLVAAGAFGLAAALCHSRAGYLAFVVTGVVVSVVCWRKLLYLLPPAVLAACLAFPTIPARFLTGIGVVDVAGGQKNDWSEISAGRSDVIWPAAWREFELSPVYGYGRVSILRTPMHDVIAAGEGGVCPTHPHNAYLEMLCDGGLASLLVVLACLAAVARTSVRLTRAQDDPMARTCGAICLAAMTALAVMGLTGQSFWPREGSMATGCVIALAVRVWALRRAGTWERAD